MTKAKEQVVKVGTLLSLLAMLSSAIIMHFHGIETSVKRSGDYTNMAVTYEHNLHEKDIKTLIEKDTQFQRELDLLKKNVEDLTRNKR